MIGGFLGAGKTTAMAALAQRFSEAGKRVGLITNDQGSGLVDTAMLRARGFASEEIPGGCFCCRFNSLVDAAKRLDERSKPDIFLAEPVGSCTDLVATVSYPLRRIYGDHYSIAPLSVLVDPVRAERIFGLSEGKRFSEKVLYIYRKQLEEADLIVISKADTVDRRAPAPRCKAGSSRNFRTPRCSPFPCASSAGLELWISRIENGFAGTRAAMPVDYEVYAEGEALLGWLNATVEVEADAPFDANALLQSLAAGIQERLATTEIAHLKMTLSPLGGLQEIAVINLVRSDFVPELSLRLEEPIGAGPDHRESPRRGCARGTRRKPCAPSVAALQRREAHRASRSPRIVPPRQAAADASLRHRGGLIALHGSRRPPAPSLLPLPIRAGHPRRREKGGAEAPLRFRRGLRRRGRSLRDVRAQRPGAAAARRRRAR